MVSFSHSLKSLRGAIDRVDNVGGSHKATTTMLTQFEKDRVLPDVIRHTAGWLHKIMSSGTRRSEQLSVGQYKKDAATFIDGLPYLYFSEAYQESKQLLVSDYVTAADHATEQSLYCYLAEQFHEYCVENFAYDPLDRRLTTYAATADRTPNGVRPHMVTPIEFTRIREQLAQYPDNDLVFKASLLAAADLYFSAGLRLNEALAVHPSELRMHEDHQVLRAQIRWNRGGRLKRRDHNRLLLLPLTQSLHSLHKKWEAEKQRSASAEFLNARNDEQNGKRIAALISRVSKSVTGDEEMSPHAYRRSFATHWLLQTTNVLGYVADYQLADGEHAVRAQIDFLGDAHSMSTHQRGEIYLRHTTRQMSHKSSSTTLSSYCPIQNDLCAAYAITQLPALSNRAISNIACKTKGAVRKQRKPDIGNYLAAFRVAGIANELRPGSVAYRRPASRRNACFLMPSVIEIWRTLATLNVKPAHATVVALSEWMLCDTALIVVIVEIADEIQNLGGQYVFPGLSVFKVETTGIDVGDMSGNCPVGPLPRLRSLANRTNSLLEKSPSALLELIDGWAVCLDLGQSAWFPASVSQAERLVESLSKIGIQPNSIELSTTDEKVKSALSNSQILGDVKITSPKSITKRGRKRFNNYEQRVRLQLSQQAGAICTQAQLDESLLAAAVWMKLKQRRKSI